MPALWLPILTKALPTALLVVCASALAEALGPFWGALVASLPVSAGPADVFLAMQHDSGFVAASALNSAAANAATGLFLIVYATRACGQQPWRSLGSAVATWFVAALAIRHFAWTPATALLLNLVVYGVGFMLPVRIKEARTASRAVVTRRPLDLPSRAAAVGLFVSAVVFASSRLGPEATGMAAVFPVSLISLLIIVRPRIGGAASALLAATALRAMLGFGLMLLLLSLAVGPFGPTAALFAALLVSILWSGGLLLLTRRPRQGTA